MFAAWTGCMRSERNEAVSQERVVSERTAEIAISTVGTQRKAEKEQAVAHSPCGVERREAEEEKGIMERMRKG